MNKFFLFALSFFFFELASAQIDEIEPNDPILLGNSLPMNTVVTGQTCMWNEPDYFQIILPEDGFLRINTSIAGEGTNPTTLLSFQLFTPNNDGWNNYLPLAGENGTFLSDVHEWCCLQADTYYVQVYTAYAFPYCFNYTLSWELVNPAFSNDYEANSTYTTAAFLDYNAPSEGHLSFYNHPQGSGQDGTDFYAFVPPSNGTVRLFVESQAESTGSNNLTVNIHTINGSAWYLQNSTVGIFPLVNSDTLTWECIGNDTMYFSITTTNYYDRGYAYRIRYDVIPMVFANDTEPNNFFPSAQLVNPSLPIEGNQLLGNSYYWAGTQEDIYKFYKPTTGFLQIKAFSETHTTDPTGGNVIQLYDHNGSPIGAPFAAPIGINSIPTVDSVYYDALDADTFYIKTYSPYVYATCRSYRLELSYEPIPNQITEERINHVNIYPNPSNGNFYVDTKNLSGTAQVQIYDFLGRCVQDEKRVLGSTFSIQLQGISPGCYFLKILSEGNEISQPFMVNR